MFISQAGNITYIFKYISKGGYRVTVEMIQVNHLYDEIINHLDARYVSASEAVWMILSFDLIYRNPPIVRLFSTG